MPPSHMAIWAIITASTAGLLMRPRGWPDYAWAVGGAALLVATGLLPVSAALQGIRDGTDVYLFLTGMMLLAELARQQGFFDWLATHAARQAGGSSRRLFTLTFALATLVTIFLSNDATAVVLTPAVAAAARAARVEDKLPYLLTCAFVANAASFVLPISNPANLVLYNSHMPGLAAWLRLYALPSLGAILATYTALRWSQRGALRWSQRGALRWSQRGALRWSQRGALRATLRQNMSIPALRPGGAVAGWGIAATSLLLLGASALHQPLGAPTFLAGVITLLLVTARAGSGLTPIARGISWGILPLVAGLFVMVRALDRTGLVSELAGLAHGSAHQAPAVSAWGSGLALALVSNLTNNLPAGLVASQVAQTAPLPDFMRAAMLIGVDLGPNLSITGSLASILWLAALRREGVAMSGWRFVRLGLFVMPPALLLALALR